MGKPWVNILYKGEAEVKHQVWAVFHVVYKVCRGKYFGQLIIIKLVK